MSADTCVIVSFYDGRTSEELVRLLRQLQLARTGAQFETRVVVNSDRKVRPQLPADLSGIGMDVRENTGVNIGAWDHGWRQNAGFDFYIFLQDECEIMRADWLERYKALLSDPKTGLVSESLLFWKNWRRFKEEWPEAHDQCVALGVHRGIALGKSPTHAQTLALGVSAACLVATDGFCVAEGKIPAVAGEVMFSRHCIDQRYAIMQSAWRPFEYFRHHQWASMRDEATGLAWHLSRAAKQLVGP